jgi:RimJ/RimL family protein N-acetyltransferase
MIIDPSTPRLRAEPLTLAHFDEVQRMHSDPVQMAMLGGVRDAAATLAYLERNVAHWDQHGFGVWMLRDTATGAMAGRGILRHLELDGVDEVEVGYGFYPAYWGKGLATEICRSCIVVGMEQLGLSTIVALTTPANSGSQHVLRKSGMVMERELVHGGTPHLLFRTVGHAPEFIPLGNGPSRSRNLAT